MGVRHLYVHLPFCGHRCGYCDFVTLTGRRGEHAGYVDVLLTELALEANVLAESLETIFVGGGTPTFTESAALMRLLAALPAAGEFTVEANPETVTPELARLLRAGGVTRVSLGAQSFQPHLLSVLERRAAPDDIRRAVYLLRDAGFDNISLDLLYGIPGQSTSDLERDLSEALALEPEHMSWYELEAKPGTRFTHAHGEELERQADAMEGYYERVVDELTDAGYRWYETANFCLEQGRANGRDLRAQHNLGYWLGRDYLGVGIGAVSTVDGVRRRNRPGLAAYVMALRGGSRPPSETETIDSATRSRERLLLGLRLDEPLPLEDVAGSFDHAAAERLIAGGLVELGARDGDNGDGGQHVSLTRRGRFLAGGVSAELMTLGSG